MKKVLLFFIIFIFNSQLTVNGQDGFRFLNENQKRQRVSFKLINNLIIIPLEINNKKLSFILDTGVNKTILFNISQNDSIGLNSVKKVALQGLGEGVAVNALVSKNNKLSLKKMKGYNETVYVVLNDYFDFSAKMGVTIHGIIGYNLLKNFIVKINYRSKVIDFYNPKLYNYKNCNKCETFPLSFFRKKPYIDAKVQLDTIGSKLTDVKLLVDSGGSDAIWLFEGTKKNIQTPIRFFKDILGEGLSGTIYGNRSRIPKIKLGSFEIKKPTVSFLDSVSTHNARHFKSRNGSIGGNVLKRFKVWIDYPNKKMVLKKNASFKDEFNYNMSGLDVMYYGKQLVKEIDEKVHANTFKNQNNQRNSINLITRYSYEFKPLFMIRNVVKNSPADKVGIKKGDFILKINNKPAHQFKLSDIINKFQEKVNKKVRITVKRNEETLKFEFRLEQKI
ncbi:aspartyl protease family protein [uncultured Polaribacter sp.]|uniref:aspartyl protease family protein n=1 Tax=uncultured Polaribacter sp. TaxID=174711 RepID=UPI0026243C14|nr:aspartyl protease family protein [uncultured Polaribacter sp.]